MNASAAFPALRTASLTQRPRQTSPRTKTGPPRCHDLSRSPPCPLLPPGKGAEEEGARVSAICIWITGVALAENEALLPEDAPLRTGLQPIVLLLLLIFHPCGRGVDSGKSPRGRQGHVRQWRVRVMTATAASRQGSYGGGALLGRDRRGRGVGLSAAVSAQAGVKGMWRTEAKGSISGA
mmetsp:Transcript_42374/g.99475  ORF Transcript_42374/g.99475 Transcript_42374/m.99475 type:complete len:180 (+) Transcript_42374:223-762(+)